MILYIETNGILELALQQERATSTEELVRLAENGGLTLVVPTIALAESYYPLRERLDRFEQYQRMTQEAMRDMGRSQAEAYARIVASGNEVEAQLGRLLVQEREALQRSILSVIKLAESIPLSADIIGASINLGAELGLTEFDAMISASVLDHAARAAEGRKAFLSYDDKLIRNAGPEMRQAGIDLFSNAELCLQYAQHFIHE